MRILLVTNYFEPAGGEAAQRLTRLARLLRQRGHEVTVLTSLPNYPQGLIQPKYRGKWVVVENRDGLRVIQTWLWATPSPRISRKLISQVSFMLTACLRGLAIPKPDVVLIEAQPIFTSLAGVFLAVFKRRPYVLNVSDLWPDHLLSVGALTERSPIYRVARKTVDFTFRRAAGITTMSPLWAEKIQQYIGRSEKVQFVYNGEDLTKFRPNLDTSGFRQRYQLGDGKLVTFIGTFATQYDFPTMLAAARFFNDRPDVRFVFVGEGSQRDALQAALADSAYSNLRWIGWLDSNEVSEAWNASYLNYWALGAHPLYRGTIPSKLYQAMACGVPIVGAMEGVSAEIIKTSGSGMTVPCGDAQGLIAAIQHLLDHPAEREQMSRSGRAYAEQHYDYQQVALAHERVLEQAARSRR